MVSLMSQTKPSARKVAFGLIGIALVAVGIRMIGIDSDREATRLSFDENYTVSDAFHLAADRTLLPNTHFYPPLYTYCLTATYGAWYLGGRTTGSFALRRS